MKAVDLIVIGSGQGGVPLAADAAAAGHKVMLFERGSLGGSCVNYGCTPSKAFLAAAHGAGRARSAAHLGVHATLRIDFPAVMERVRKIRQDFVDGVKRRLDKANVEVVHAEATLGEDGVVRAGDIEATARRIVINTGTTARIPRIVGLAGTPYLTNANFFDLRELPRRTAVLGGGYIGLELGQGLARLGSQVHLIHRGKRPLDHEEPEIGDTLTTALERDGIELRMQTELRGVSHDGREFTLELSDGGKLVTDALLVALGRTPNTKTLTGVDKDNRGYVVINERFETSRPGVWAIGDAAGQPAFTHVSWEDYRRLSELWKGETRTRDDRVLAYAVYTEPQVGRVGLSLQQASAQGLEVRHVEMPVTHIARAIEWGHDLGFYRLVVERGSDRIVGATFVGYEAGELIHVILAHIMAGSKWQLLDQSVHIHPTYGEGLPSLARLLE